MKIKMNFIRHILITLIILTPNVYAANESLNIGITSFDPPFIIQGSDKNIYGFDVDMMNSLCKILQRSCQFHVMRFEQLLPAVANRTIDAALSSITITADRSKIVSFSLPYLLSYSRFLTKNTKEAIQPFSLVLLNGKTIGIETGTIFGEQIKSMGIKNPTNKKYPRTEELLEGLSSGELDYILLDNPTALYWEANSTGTLATVGPAFMYGYGIGIATNPNLVTPLNKALLQYQTSPNFKENYTRYLTQF